VVHKDVTHSRNLIPRDIGLDGKEIGADVRDRLAELHQARATRVVGNAVVQIAVGDEVAYAFNGVLNVG